MSVVAVFGWIAAFALAFRTMRIEKRHKKICDGYFNYLLESLDAVSDSRVEILRVRAENEALTKERDELRAQLHEGDARA